LRRSTLVIASLLFSTSLNACSQPEGKMVEGTWIPVDAQLGGQPYPPTVLKTMKLTIADGKYVVDVGGQLDKGTVALQTASTPKGMDVTGTEGPNAGKTFPAIYEVHGDTLRICYDLSGRQRPSEFRSAPGSLQFLVNYARAKG